MSKIDIAIKVTSDGAGEPIAITGGEWTQNVIDIRQVLNSLQGLDVEGRVVRILSFTDEGAIVTLARLVPGRGGDNVAAWIFIPSHVGITGSEVVDILEKTERVIVASEFDLQPLRELCNKDYPNRRSFSKAPTGNRLAYRQYDSASLPRLLGPDRYQPYYDAYRYILLLDDEGQIEVRKTVDADDLTRYLVSTLSMVTPPDAEALRRHFRHEVKVILPDGTPFDHPIAAKMGESIKVFFVREGYKPLECKVKKTDNDAFSPMSLSPIRSVNWVKIVDASMFNFVDEQGYELPADVHPTLKINGKKLGAYGMEIAEYELRQVNVEASAINQGYEGFAQFVDLSQPAPYVIRLSRRMRESKNKVVMRNGEIANMTLVSKYVPDHHNGPLRGYVFDRRTGNLVYDKSRVWAHRVQGLLAGLLLMGLCWGIYAIVNGPKEKKPVVTVVDEPKPKPEPDENDTPIDSSQLVGPKVPDIEEGKPTSDDFVDYASLSAAIAYLDGNQNWNRDEMENYAYLMGLFDDMNTFNFDKILGNWNEELKDSKKFKDVADYALVIKQKGKNPAIGKHNPTYCPNGDFIINRQNYINHLYNTINPPKAPVPINQRTKGASAKSGKTGEKRVDKTDGKTDKERAGSKGKRGIDKYKAGQ